MNCTHTGKVGKQRTNANSTFHNSYAQYVIYVDTYEVEKKRNKLTEKEKKGQYHVTYTGIQKNFIAASFKKQ